MNQCRNNNNIKTTMTSETTKVKWQDDPCRVLLQTLIENGSLPSDMKPQEAWKLRDEFSIMEKKLFTSRLNSMRKMIANKNNTNRPKKKTKAERKAEAWNRRIPIRTLLKDDVHTGPIGWDLSPNKAWEMRPEYNDNMTLDLFKSRLIGMRKIVKEGLERAAADEAALKHDRLICPRPLLNARGEPHWEGSDAQTLLEIDVEAGVHQTFISPEDFYRSRMQYQSFPLTVFRGHIYQEVKTQKWRKQWVDGKKEYALVPEPN